MELSKGIDTKVNMTAHMPVEFLFEVSSNNMVTDNDSAMKGKQLSLIEESYTNKE